MFAQTYVAPYVDLRLDAGTFANILDLGKAVLPGEDVEVEVEYDCCVTAQSPLAEARLPGNHELRLDEKHTDCLAKESCGIDSGCAPSGCC